MKHAGITRLLGPLPLHVSAERPLSRPCAGAFLRCGAHTALPGATGPIRIPNIKRWLALELSGPYWMVPRVSRGPLALASETQFLLWERHDRTFGILLPLVHNDRRAVLEPCGEHVRIAFDGVQSNKTPSATVLAFAAAGADPYQLVRDAMACVATRLGTLRLREEKPAPAFCDLLGWCTWDAFYHTVDARKILAGLRSFATGGVRPGFMIVDDGWEERDGDLLNSFEPDAKKFPGGFGPLISRAKRDFGVEIFGIHHPFQGYWAGVNPRSDLARRYRMVRNKGCIRPWLGPKKDALCFVHPDDIHRFYSDFYAELRAAGADMVKVDGQSAMHLFSEGKLNRAGTMRAYQQAQQGAAAVQFGAQTIPCMSNGSDVLYNLNASNGWRNSTDYFPGRPAQVQQFHIYANAMNNLWSSTFAIPDWDMFQSHQPEASFHAAARAISGGPIYVCDKPRKQNFELLKKVCTSDGRLLRCDRPALVTRDRLFVDTHHSPRLLKVCNVSGERGVLGLFHVTTGHGPIEDSFCAADCFDLNGTQFAAYCHTTGAFRIAARHKRFRAKLEPMGWEIVTFAPVIEAFAPIGLLDKFNSAAAIESTTRFDRAVRVVLRDGGTFGCWCARKPRAVTVDNKRHAFSYEPTSGLLRLTVGAGASRVIDMCA